MKRLRSHLLLVLTAFIWGCAFVAQSSAMDAVGPFTFTCLRSVLALIALSPLVSKAVRANKDKQLFTAHTVSAGIVVGLALAVASMFQQYGIMFTTVGKAGFITALYVVFVPILSLFLGKKVHHGLWGCVALSAVGLYLLCMQGSFILQNGDTLVFLCAISFAVHILVIDYFASHVNPIVLSWIQFFTVALVCFVPMIVFEHPDIPSILSSWKEIAYAGILSSAAGYTLQMIAQKDADPTIASMIMSLESVFATLAGFVLLHQTLTLRELSGCVIIFIAIIIAQVLPQKL